MGGLEAVWQLPPPGVVTQGVLLLTHGCGTSATLSWPRSASCTLCTGVWLGLNLSKKGLYNGTILPVCRFLTFSP